MTTTQELVYCVKCKAKTESVGMVNITMKNGRDATQCRCAVCDTTKYRIGKHMA